MDSTENQDYHFCENQDDEIVVSGMAGRFPNCENIDELSYNLYNKIDMVTDREERWSHSLFKELSKRKGITKNVYKFDNNFFGVPPKQMRSMDPQCRLLIECAYEAIVDAGTSPQEMRGKKIGVFTAASISESEVINMNSVTEDAAFVMLGNSRAMLSNRVSYALGLTGSSCTIDAACSSSLYALDVAVKAIRNGDIDGALVCGANLLFLPQSSVFFHRLGVLSKGGICKPFDENCDGYTRADAVSAIFLQKMKNSKRVYAKLLNSMTNCDGYKEEGITFPSAKVQKKLLENFYMKMPINPTDLSYVEAHATGTRVGDPEECRTLDAIFCQDRTTPLLVGSIKSSVGHSEAAAGLSSIIKVLLAYQTGMIAPNINLTQPRTDPPALTEGRMLICTEPTILPGSALLGVSAFGFGGANGHVLFARFLKPKQKLTNENLPYLVTWAGRTEESIDAIVNKLSSMPLDIEFIALMHNVQREENPALSSRGFGIFQSNGPTENAACVGEGKQVYDGQKRPIVWVFAGMGSQWVGMGAALMEIPMFRETIERCHGILAPYGIDITAIITSTDPTTFDNILNSFVGIAAIQIALINILRCLGVTFDFLIGHSVGELGCAYADDCFTEEQMLLAAYCRGLVSLNTKLVDGSMAAIGLSYSEVIDMLPSTIDVACHNSANSSTISGPKADVREFIDEMVKRKIFAVEVPTSNIAYHSRYIQELGEKFVAKLRQVIPTPTKRSKKWLSTSVPMAKWSAPESELSSAEYHRDNLLSPVLFEETAKLLPKNALTIEIAPHGLLQSALRTSLPNGLHIALTNRREEKPLNSFLRSLGRLFSNGIMLNVDRMYPTVQFPVSSQTPCLSSLVKWDHTQDWHIRAFQDGKKESRECKFIISLTMDEYKYMAGHNIDGRVLVPATSYLHLVRQTRVMMTTMDINQVNMEFENVKLLRATTLGLDNVHLVVSIHMSSGEFEITEGSSVVVTGIVRLVENPLPILQLRKEENHNYPLLQTDQFYKELRLRGYNYNDMFRSVQEATTNGSHGKVRWLDDNFPVFMDNLLQLCILRKDSRELFVPTSIRKIRMNVTEHFRQLAELDPENPIFDVQSFEQHDAIVGGGIEIIGLDVSPISRRKQAGVEVLETYTFVPFNNPLNFYIKEDAMRIFAQTIMENSLKSSVKLLEIDDGDESTIPLIHTLDDVFARMPLIDADLKIKTNRTIEDLDEKYLEEADKKTQDKYNIIVQSNVFGDETMAEIQNYMADNVFLISRESTESEWNSDKMPKGFQLIYVLRTSDETFVMAQKIQEPSQQEVTIIELPQDDTEFGWLAQLQNAIKDGPVLLVAQKNSISGILGLMNCIRREPGAQTIRCLFIMDKKAPRFYHEDYFFVRQLKLNLSVNVYRNGFWGTYRHLKFKECLTEIVQDGVCSAQISRIGDLSSFVWKMSIGEKVPHNPVAIHYASINFRDIMIATGRLANIQDSRLKRPSLGIEYSGVDANDERIMGMIETSAFSTYAKPFDNMYWKVPKEFTLEEAATIPVAYITVYYAFFCGNTIAKGKTILIHAGSGAVGLAAIRIAFAYGLEVFTTVSTQQKKDYIMEVFPQLKEENIGNTRDSSFEKLVKEQTNGKGVDYVLNSLSEEKLLASVRCLGRGGIFLEIGKFDFFNNSNLGMAVFKNEITFRSVFADNLVYRPDMRNKVYDLIDIDLKNGIIQPLKSTVFQADEIEKAFRYLSTGKHMGKVMIQIRSTETSKDSVPINVIKTIDFDPNLVYIVLGGLGGFGLELADWMVLRGARKLVLSSRSALTNSYQAFRKRVWESYGCKVYIDINDITSYMGCRKLLLDASMHGIVKGIFNLAMVLQDSILENQTTEKFRECLAPKAYATQYLDEQSRQLCPQLRYFVVFSSASCGRGNPGQSNYGMANSIMERIVEQRVEQGLPGKAIQWGAIGDVGVLANDVNEKFSKLTGVMQQRIASCLDALDALLLNPDAVVSSMIVAQKRSSSDSSAIMHVMHVMGITDLKSVSQTATLTELGMDSLMAVEIKQILERELNMILTATDLRTLTFAKLHEYAESKQNDIVNEPSEEIFNLSNFSQFLDHSGTSFYTSETTERLREETEEAKKCVLLIPGIEGFVFGALRDLGHGIDAEVFALNVQKFNEIDNITDFTASIFENTLNIFKDKEAFILISHSFGGLIAVDLARRLEGAGLKGHLLLIDGYPKLLKQVANASINATDGENTPEKIVDFAISSVVSVLGRTTPDEILYIIKDHQTFEAKLSALSTLPHEINQIPSKLLRELIMGFHNRFLMSWNAETDTVAKIESPITLVRSIETSTVEAEDRKQLEAYTNGAFDVVTVEGSHFTILSNDSLYKFINDTFLAN